MSRQYKPVYCSKMNKMSLPIRIKNLYSKASHDVQGKVLKISSMKNVYVKDVGEKNWGEFHFRITGMINFSYILLVITLSIVDC